MGLLENQIKILQGQIQKEVLLKNDAFQKNATLIKMLDQKTQYIAMRGNFTGWIMQGIIAAYGPDYCDLVATAVELADKAIRQLEKNDNKA